ncbi:MAG: histidinol-phosphatase [Bacteroidales bacterium]|nr:histidinol-phosphatase [Bacteroidales bacterium]
MQAKKIFVLLLLTITTLIISAQTRQNFRVPDIPGYLTLKGDFHMHTPFSDGTVWPADRVKEAWRDGLDVIAITDHVEYNPNKKDVSTDLNRPYEIAFPVAEKYGILLIRAAEITRSMPPGHFNAYFLTDANLLRHADVDSAFQAAADQGAYFIWNHPGWKAQQPDSTHWFPIHTEFHQKGWLHGIEVFNEKEFYPVVLRWATEKNLTCFANSDVHEPIDFLYDPSKKERRPMTLVFAKDRTTEAVKEAFFEHRTLAFFNDTLAGNEIWLKALIGQCIALQKSSIKINEKNEAVLILNNLSDIPFRLTGISTDDFSLPATIELNANSSTQVSVRNIKKTNLEGKQSQLAFTVKNALSGDGNPLTIGLNLKFHD